VAGNGAPSLQNGKGGGYMLLGTYYHNIDEKGRMIFPAKFREELGLSFVITQWLDGCLAVFSQEEFSRISSKLYELPMGMTPNLQRKLFSNGDVVEPDKQGRILIPTILRKKAGLARDVAVLGVQNRVEIWDRERWDEICAQDDNEEMQRLMNEFHL